MFAKRQRFLFVTMAMAVVGTVVAASPAFGLGGHEVEIRDNLYDPAQVSVSVGETVTWRHAGSDTHSVTADDGAFNSGSEPAQWLTNGATFSFTFTQQGVYAYHCEVHGPSMAGTITVVAAATETPTPAPTPTEPPATATPTPVPAPTPVVTAPATASPTPAGSPTPVPSLPQTPRPPGFRTLTPTPRPTLVPLPGPADDSGGGLSPVVIILAGLFFLGAAGAAGYYIWRGRLT